MPYYVTCPNCGCSLDPGEKCDCGNMDALSIWPDGDDLNGREPEMAHSDVLMLSY